MRAESISSAQGRDSPSCHMEHQWLLMEAGAVSSAQNPSSSALEGTFVATGHGMVNEETVPHPHRVDLLPGGRSGRVLRENTRTRC